MSTFAWAIASDMPRAMRRALYASVLMRWNRIGRPSISDMIRAMSLYERSSGPKTGTLATPVHA